MTAPEFVAGGLARHRNGNEGRIIAVFEHGGEVWLLLDYHGTPLPRQAADYTPVPPVPSPWDVYLEVMAVYGCYPGGHTREIFDRFMARRDEWGAHRD